MHFCLKNRTPVWHLEGRVFTINGVASAKRYPWGHAKQDRVSACVLSSSMARWKDRFLWTFFSCGQRPISSRLGPEDTKSFPHDLVCTHGDKMYLSLRADWCLEGSYVVEEPNSAYRWLPMAASHALQSRFLPIQVRVVTIIAWVSYVRLQ